MTTSPTTIRVLVVFITILTACGRQSADTSESAPAATANDATVVVYASHNAAETAAVLGVWRAETGGSFQLLTDDMPEGDVRLGNPALKPDADLILAASLAEIWAVAEADALRPVFSDTVSANIERRFVDPESRWVALSRRARVVAYNTDRIDRAMLDSIDSYASLRDEALRGQLCLSSSAVPGNRALVAFLIGRHGVREAEVIVRQWRANLGMTVFTNDGTLLNAIADGRCGIGFVASPVLASFIGREPDAPVAVHWFDDYENMLTDVSAVAVTRHAKQPAAAQKLLEWLTTAAPNAVFAGRRFEFPANAEAQLASSVAGWAGNLPQTESYAERGFIFEEARLLIERARYP